MPDESSRLTQSMPPFAFVGVATRVATNAHSFDVLGLSHTLALPFYPIRCDRVYCVLGIKKDLLDSLEITTTIADQTRPSAAASRTVTMTLTKEPAKSDTVDWDKITDANSVPYKKAASVNVLLSKPDTNNPSYILMPFPAPPLLLVAPTAVLVSASYNGNSYDLGSFQCVFSAPSALTSEEITAIKSRPGSSKQLAFNVICKLCKDNGVFYQNLSQQREPTPQKDDPAIWLGDAGDTWTCRCKAVSIPLHYVKKGFHDLFRTPSSNLDENVETLRPLYERGRIGQIFRDFQALIHKRPREEDFQQFIEDNPIIWSFLSPLRIFHKPAILSKYKADFGVLTVQNILYLIEIERADTEIHTKKGELTAAFNHAFEQVKDWAYEIANHRVAVLSGLGLQPNDVSEVRYMVVAGIATDASPTVLAKLHQNLPASGANFFGYDELAAFLHHLELNLGRAGDI